MDLKTQKYHPIIIHLLFLFLLVPAIYAQEKTSVQKLRMNQEKNYDDYGKNLLNGRQTTYNLLKRFNVLNAAETTDTLIKISDNIQSDTETGGPKKNEIYKRSSIYTMLIADSVQPNYHIINGFGNVVLPEKFNNHNIGPYIIYTNPEQNNKDKVIANYLRKENVAKKLIAKWFNRKKNGAFDTKLVANRGMYNASELDKAIAEKSERGIALLKDAGEDLIQNTFVIVFDIQMETLNEASGAIFNNKDKVEYQVTSYLYRLNWNERTAAIFYSDYWMDNTQGDSSNKKLFEESKIFQMEYIGNFSFVKKEQQFFTNSQGIMLDKLIKEFIDKSIFNLEVKFTNFRSKFPLFTGTPITAKVGKKEGIKTGDKFEVLEKILNADGSFQYKNMGTIEVENDEDIWDNSTEGSWFSENPGKEFTVFKGKKRKYQSGMLIRQIY